MLFDVFPEYPESALVFSFKRSKYLKPEEQKQFFRIIAKKFGKNTHLRSFTLFETAFHEISFWIYEPKVGSIFQKIFSKIKGEPHWVLVDRIALNLADEFSKKFDMQIKGKVIEVNKNPERRNDND